MPIIYKSGLCNYKYIYSRIYVVLTSIFIVCWFSNSVYKIVNKRSPVLKLLRKYEYRLSEVRSDRPCLHASCHLHWL